MAREVRNRTIFVLWGVVLVLLGFFLFFLGVSLGPIRLIFFNPESLQLINEAIVWYSGIPIVLGALFIAYDLVFVVRHKRLHKEIVNEAVGDDKIIVALTAYNDEESIAAAVEDFLSHSKVGEVIVVSNNSTDNTMANAEAAGATVYNEEKQGYGACVHRCLTEAVKRDNTELMVLCEGDLTFRAYDIDKLFSYINHADLVNGTRIVEQLQDNNTQLSMFMHYGNYFVGKLLELKYLGDVTLSDVGTTYKMCKVSMLKELLPKLDPNVNLEFNPYFIEKTIRNGYDVVECPITFHPRVGESKGGNINDKVALRLGIKMIFGIMFGWKESKINE